MQLSEYKYGWQREKLKLRKSVHVGLWLGDKFTYTDVSRKLHYILTCMCWHESLSPVIHVHSLHFLTGHGNAWPKTEWRGRDKIQKKPLVQGRMWPTRLWWSITLKQTEQFWALLQQCKMVEDSTKQWKDTLSLCQCYLILASLC